MKKLVAFLLLAACELQPAPPPPPAGSAAPAPAPAGSAAPTVAGSGAAGSAAAAPRPATPPPVDVTPECEQAGIKLAEVMINAAEESQKPAFERDRANIIRRTEVVCTQQRWTPAALACISQSKNDNDARACLEKFPAPGAQPPPPAAGSAAGSGMPKERRPGGLDVHGAAGPSRK